MNAESGVGKDLLSACTLDPVDGTGADQVAVRRDDISTTAGSGFGGGRLGGPVDDELRALLDTDSPLNRPGDDPLDKIAVGSVAIADDDSSGVFEVGGVDSIDRVGTAQSGVVVTTDSQRAGQSREIQHGTEGHRPGDPPKPLHGREATDPTGSSAGPKDPLLGDGLQLDTDERLVIPRWVKLGGGILVAVIAAAMAFAIFEPIQVLPRFSIAPGYSLLAQDGSTVNSESARGVITLYSFAPSHCGDECGDMNLTMAEVRDRVGAEIDLGEVDFQLVTIALDPITTPEQLAVAAERSGAQGRSWTWLGGEENEIRTIVGDGFGRFFETEDDGSIRYDPGFILVDGNGMIRGNYRYQTLADDAEKLVQHVDILAEEIRYADGPGAVAYEAAHLFLCYP